MKWNKIDIQELMLRSLDFPLTPEESKKLEEGLLQFPELVVERDELMNIREALSGLKLEASPSFQKQVMAQLPSAKEVTLTIAISRWLPRVAAACLVAIALAALSVYLTEGSLTTEAIMGIQDLAPEDAYTYLEN